MLRREMTFQELILKARFSFADSNGSPAFVGMRWFLDLEVKDENG